MVPIVPAVVEVNTGDERWVCAPSDTEAGEGAELMKGRPDSGGEEHGGFRKGRTSGEKEVRIFRREEAREDEMGRRRGDCVLRVELILDDVVG